MGGEYYERLGVPADASTEEIAAAYRERLKETHPDVSDASDAGERTKRLIEAKEVLTDETERARYDRLGHDQYVSLEGDGTATSGGSSRTDEPDTGDERSDSDTAGTDTTAGDSTGERTGGRSRGGRTSTRRPGHTSGARSARGVDWGTHATGGVDWDEWNDTDWEAVSEAVWQEVTGTDSSTRSRHAAADWGTATDRDTATASTGQTGATDGHGWSGRTGSTGHGGVSSTAADATTGSTATADPAGTTASSAGRAPDGATTATHDGARVGWYSGGDPSGTAHDAWSFGETDVDGESWRSWTPGTERDGRHGQGGFPPHRILSPFQTVVLFCLCFVTYPLLVGSAVFPLFSSPVRIVFAIFLVFVVALLIVLPQLGVLVFGGWTVLFPLAFANLGIALLAPESLLTMGAVTFSLGLSGFSWLLSRPPVL